MFRTKMVLVIFFSIFFNVQIFADSPITSTPFYKAYLQSGFVLKAANTQVLDQEMANFLSDTDVQTDTKAALINALSWEKSGSENTNFFYAHLARRYGTNHAEHLKGKITADELFCWGYLTVMDDYHHPENGFPLLKLAQHNAPKNFVINLILALTEAQELMSDQSSWCSMWELTDEVLNDRSLSGNMRQPAINIVRDYMILYKDDCKSANNFSFDDDPCANATTQIELNECAKKAYQTADAELNRVYKNVTSQVGQVLKQKILVAQRAWLSYRDAHCDAMTFNYKEGSIYPTIRYNCLTDLTNKRIQALQDLVRP